MIMRALAVSAAIASSACMPMVQHGPWVREGTSGGFMVGALHANDVLADDDLPRTFIGFDGGIRKGFVPADSSKPAFALGAQTSLWTLLLLGGAENWQRALSFLSGDAYLSLPLAGRTATSIGATASFYHLLPYVQIGSKTPQGGWYTTQSLLFVRDEDTFLWLPSITKLESDRRPRGTHFTIGGGIGSRHDQPYYLFTVAVFMEFFERKAVR